MLSIQFDQFNLEDKEKQLKIFIKNDSKNILSESFFDGVHKFSPDNLFLSQNVTSNENQNNCAICIQNMTDIKIVQSDTILSLLCGHYFHCDCLKQWKQQVCPLCRYHLQPPQISFCQSCNSCQNLWICMVCGMKHCVQKLDLKQSHMFYHYQLMNHTFAMQIQTKFIYDNSRGAFVHRLFYNQMTGKPKSFGDFDKKQMEQAKQSQLILKAQLQQQRKYFQMKIHQQNKIQREAKFRMKKKMQIIQKELAQVQQQLSSIQNNIARDEKLQQKLIQGYNKTTEQIKQLQKKYKMFEAKLKEDQKKNCCKEDIAKMRQQLKVLQEQIKDIQNHFRIQSKLKNKLGKQVVKTSAVFQTKKK